MLKQLPFAARYTVPPILVALCLTLVFLLPDAFTFALTFERPAIEQGQWWRLVTGQFVHLTLGHLLLNLSGLLLFWLLFAEHAPGRGYFGVVLVIACGASLGMYVFDSEMFYYVGFSGTLYGLFAWGALQDVFRKVALGWLLLLGITAKAVYDYFLGAGASLQMTSESDTALAVSAHFFGVLTGIMLAFIQLLVAKTNRRSRS